MKNMESKELDPETGFYYYGARYLEPKTSRWISGDPAMAEYLPSAPVNDEARKRNGSLPGMGGVFNYVNLHCYHYAGNNPVRYTDPDGEKNIPILAVYTMNEPGSEWFNTPLTNDPDINNTIGSAGCAVTAMADLSHTIGGNLNPKSINASCVTNGNVNWDLVASALGLGNLGKTSEPLTKDQFYEQESSNIDYYTFVNVNYESSGKEHWVGVKGFKTIGGKDYFSITGTSMNDKNDGFFPSGNRGMQGWIKDGNNIYVPVDQVKEYQRFFKSQNQPYMD